METEYNCIDIYANPSSYPNPNSNTNPNPITLTLTLAQTLTLKQWRSKGGKGGHAPWGAGLGGAAAHFLQSYLKTCFKQKFRPKYT